MGTNGNEVQSHCGANYGLSPYLLLFMKPGDIIRFDYNGETMICLKIIGHPCHPDSQVTALTSDGLIVKNRLLTFTIIDTEIKDYEE